MEKEKFFDRKMQWLLAGAFFILLPMLALHAPSLDARLYYSDVEAVEFFSRLTPVEISRYRITEALDFLFISLYTASLVLAAQRLRLRPWAIAFVPALFDLVETNYIFWSLTIGISVPAWLGWVTYWKWISAAVVLALLAVMAVWRSLRLSKVRGPPFA